MITWSWLSNKRPVDVSLKKRIEGTVTVAYSKRLEMCYLNKVAGKVLGLSDGVNTVEDIVRQLLTIYAVDEQELKSDVVDLVRDLQWKRLIRLEG